MRASHVLRLGYTSDVARSRGGLDLLARLRAALDARVIATPGGQEALLERLEKGRLDLVLARFDRATPWADRVALAPPLDHGRTPVRAAGRNGEHRWMMLVEQASRAVAPDAAR